MASAWSTHELFVISAWFLQDFALSLHDTYMVPAWSQRNHWNDHCMINECSLHDPCMIIRMIHVWSWMFNAWSLHDNWSDPYMIHAWSMHGQCMVPSWSLHDHCIIPAWSQHDPSMIHAWSLEWSLHDSCMITDWLTLCRKSTGLCPVSTSVSFLFLSDLCMFFSWCQLSTIGSPTTFYLISPLVFLEVGTGLWIIFA